ncbi:long polar fimbrial protein LpfD [Buttiauxella agrestis]|uniref:Long polar fimbrial protein LpfD n=1 Tax=Buttiauxella agrestis TaxID=82977 RepID=A0A381KNQ8_9ENTR|nr:fimbrial protein [Buttiauxella agrestis]SUY92928.1 long polar fimbrial protein LpfD [Buttiauxella agrestis]
MKCHLTLVTLLRKGLLIIGLLLGVTNIAHAYTGWCTPEGSAQQYHYNFGNITILDVNKNVGGFLFPRAYNWDLGGTYIATCDCDPVAENLSPTYYDKFYRTMSSLMPGHTDGEYQFFKISDYLEVASDIWVAGAVNSYKPTPWTNENNLSSLTNGGKNPTNPGACKGSPSGYGAFGTGSKGRIKIYIAKPFIGSTLVNNIKLLDIYGSVTSGSFGGTPMASVYINGVVTAPQNCEINAGQIVTVDFGQMWAGDFTTKGQRPTNAPPQTVKVPIKCNNIPAFGNLTLRIQSEPSAQTPEAIKTNNPDVGVEILDDSGHLLLPNTGLVPFSVDENSEATVTFKAVPVSTTGNTPASGLFQAQAYIRIDFA